MSTKESVLELLESKRGECLSGEHIARLLGITRSAVWKAVNEIKKDGYKIEAGTNKGYSLLSVNDIISLQGLSMHLPQGSDNIHIYKTLESTSNTAKEMALANAPHGTVVIADTQTSGRGRYGRNFFSPPGCGLYISFILKPEFLKFTSPEMITVFAAVCVCEAIKKACGKSAGIKWVNDIFFEGKKICGILTEGVTDFESQSLQWIVLGIGINVLLPKDGFPEGVSGIASALYSEGETPVSRNELAATLITEVLSSDRSEQEVLREYEKRLIMLGKEITVKAKNGDYRALAVGVGENGHLIVKKENGEICELFSGEISIKI